jgi:hypothetical protein
MNIPNLPTDNLYKFCSIFGLILFVFGIYLIYDSNLEVYKARQKLVNLADDYIKSEPSIDSLDVKVISIDSVRMEFINPSKYRFSHPNIVKSYMVSLIVFGFLLGAFGFHRWYFKTQKYVDQILKNEALKIPYEKEYDIYKLIWSNIIDLRNATLQLRPFLDYKDKSKSDEEIKAERLSKHYDCYNRASEVIEKNKPFYSSQVFESILKAMKLTRFEAIDYEHDDDDRKKAMEQIDTIINELDHICELIRHRLDEMKVN